MFKKITFIIVLISITFSSFSQNSVNDYKYVIVPHTFEFLKEANQYRLNNLTKLLFEKYGFTAIMEGGILPDDALSNSCLVLKSNVLKGGGVFKTKLQVELKNCKGDIIYTSQFGESRDKKFQVAYNLALRVAFNSFETLNYSYKENPIILSYGSPIAVSNDTAIEKLKEQISQLKEEKEKIKAEVKVLPQKEKTVLREETITKSIQPIGENYNTILSTKKIFNGFQLLDNTSSIVMIIYDSGIKDVFIVKGKDAIIYKKEKNWIYSETNDHELLTKIINIKF